MLAFPFQVVGLHSFARKPRLQCRNGDLSSGRVGLDRCHCSAEQREQRACGIKFGCSLGLCCGPTNTSHEGACEKPAKGGHADEF